MKGLKVSPVLGWCVLVALTSVQGCAFQLRPDDRALQTRKYRVTATYEGIAGIYGHGMAGMGTMQSMPGMHGRHNMLGERWDPERLTVAHRSWPAGTLVRVTNLENDRSAVARVTDRIEVTGKSRLCDISPGLATVLDVGPLSRAHVRVEILEPFGGGQKASGPPSPTRKQGRYLVLCGPAMPKDRAEALAAEISRLAGRPWLEQRSQGFQVVVVATDDVKEAEKIKAQLESQGYEARIQERTQAR